MNREIILEKTAEIFAKDGYHGLSMRHLADDLDITLSTIYHYFPSKDELLLILFNTTNTKLGILRRELSDTDSASSMLRDRIDFQFEHARDVMVVLNYYRAYRDNFVKHKDGFLPEKTYLHIEEVLKKGIASGEFKTKNMNDDAKVVTHAINGFVYEYYPEIPQGSERRKLIDRIHRFLIKGLVYEE